MSEPNSNKRDIWNDNIQNYPQNTFPPGTAAQQSQGNFYVNQEQHQQQQQSPSPPGNFTMLSVGHGNYLKVYHNSDETMNYNNYELFSNKSFVPLSINKNIPTTNNEQFLFQSENQINANNQTQSTVPTNNDGVATSTSMFINQLVGNWTPNVSGNYSPFGEKMVLPENSNKFGSIINLQDNNNIVLDNINQPTIQHKQNIHVDNKKPIKPTTEVKKQRIIAEVKPMRMSYSDVLSQNVSINKNDTINNINSNNNGTQINNIFNNNNNNTNTPVKTIKLINDKNKPNITSITTSTSNNGLFDKKLSSHNNIQSEEKENNNNIINKTKKILNIANQKYELNSNNIYNNEKEKKNPSTEDDLKDNLNNIDIDIKNINNNNKRKMNNSKIKIKNKNEQNQQEKGNKKKLSSMSSSQQENDDDYDYDDYDIDNDDQENVNYYYNVTKTTTTIGGAGGSGNFNDNHNIEKILKSSSHTNKRNNNTNKITGTINLRSTNKYYEKNSYNNKRNYQKSRRNRKYAFFIKFMETWLEYMIKVLTWFMSLCTDIIFLSCGIFYDRLKLCYYYLLNGYRSIKIELKNNSGMPTNWIKKLYKRFDSKFNKTSKWAFWRKLFLKKKLPEPISDFYKNGRLPQTGDEAMYSLLNCKGKDAYSILGVSPECTQEQIRKHYKKIAVLVHPDKNKQAGAEEAFKILQRAFELIGEPENRKAYDQSVAEVLNAEKAWSELNDLLAQLHTKIAEAANTIRCSSCGLRHPRKPTGRPHYAARECNSCKIRHSAREGDIWAETSVFGLRWKYLALMEGTVYDITEWAYCQKGALSHLQPNSHIVQYRIVLGGQQLHADKDKIKKNTTQAEPNLDDFLNNLYGGPNQQPQSSLRRRKK